MNSLTQITVPFHGAQLFIIEHNNQPYTPMKTIVEGMGLAWQAQLTKLNSNKERWGITKIVIPTLGDMQEAVCLPLRKLFGWLMTISPNKIPNLETRAKVIMYQNECDDVLWDYWTKGQAINPRPRVKRTTKDKRTALHEAIAILMTKSKYLHFKDCYKIIHQRFNVDHLDEIPEERLPEAVQYVHGMICGNTEPHIQGTLHDHNVQFLMWYVPILAKFIKNEVYPALTAIQSNYAGRLCGLAQETVVHANLLNRKAIGYGITHLEHVNNRPVHTMEWYLSKQSIT